MPNIILARCAPCAIPAGCYKPWIKGMSCDGYDCNPPKAIRTNFSIGTDFVDSTYGSFGTGVLGSDPCEFNGIAPYLQNQTSTTCNAFPAGQNACCCVVPSASGCPNPSGGTQCEWFVNDTNTPGSFFVNFNLLCKKTGVDLAPDTCEETNYAACCGFFGSANCGSVACGCDLLYGNTTCVRDAMATFFGDPCGNASGCPGDAGFVYTTEPVMTSFYGFDAAVLAGALLATDPVGTYQTALTFNSLTGDTFTARVRLYDHRVDLALDPITMLAGFAGFFGGPPDDDVATPWGNFPNGPYSPNNAGGGYLPWVTITLTMTSGPYSGIVYNYGFYGTAAQFAAWALINWDPVKTGRISIVGSPNYWMGLRVPPDALNTTTGQYLPVHEFRRIMTRTTTAGGVAGWMPDNSDDWTLFSTTPTNVVFKCRLVHFYKWRTETFMYDYRAHGMSIDLITTAPNTCCDLQHCTRTRSWYGTAVVGAPCEFTAGGMSVDTSGTCSNPPSAPGGTTHTDFCYPSKCEYGWVGTVTGFTDSTCVASQYNVDFDFDFVNDAATFSSFQGCIFL
jgi:hypothetical protein